MDKGWERGRKKKKAKEWNLKKNKRLAALKF